MLPDLGAHAVFIWASYAVVGGVLTGLAAWLVIEGRTLERKLGALEGRTTKRGGETAKRANPSQ